MMLLLLRDFCHYQYLLIFLIYLVIFFQIQSSITINSATAAIPTVIASNQYLYRLPNTSIPLNYDLRISINDTDDDYFNGMINIEIIIKNTTNEIVLNARKLNDFQINIIDLYTNLPIPNIQFTTKSSFLIIYCDDEWSFVENRKYLLKIWYNGAINDYEAAIFKTTPTELTYNKIIATIFEATYAREAFPCYDEPKYKAKFTLTLNYPSSYSAISNMPVDGDHKISNDGTIKTTKFIQTPLMSSYLLAFAIHQNHNVTIQRNNITHTVYYSNLKDQYRAQFSVQKSANFLQFMEKYFRFPYTMSKLDQIGTGIDDIGDNAMENWGLIIFADLKFLIEPDCHINKNIQKIVLVLHEMVHQWFGNLVSPKWWTYIWLNEGFATYYSFLIADKVFPDCKIFDNYVVESLSFAYISDTDRPISSYPQSDDEVERFFDEISYDRAAAIIRMVHNTVTESAFDRGIAQYLNKFQFSVADEDELFDCLAMSVQEANVKFFNETGFLVKFMKTWTTNRGYPNLYVNRNYSTGEIILTQSSSSSAYQESNNNSTQFWYIPITFCTSAACDFDNNEIDFMMPATTSSQIKKLNLKHDQWLILNKKSLGFYRINYDRKNWLLIANALQKNHQQFHLYNRIQILRDINYFVRNKPNSIAFDALIEILLYMKNEDELIVWNEGVELFKVLNQLFAGTKIEKYFKALNRQIIRPYYKKLLNQKSVIANNNSTKFVKIYELACKIDLDECLRISYKYFKAFLNSEFNYLAKGNEFNLICGGVKYATPHEFQLALNKSLELPTDYEIMSSLVNRLLCTTNPQQIHLMLYRVWQKYNNTNSLHLLLKFIFQLYVFNDRSPLIIGKFYLEQSYFVENRDLILYRMQNHFNNKYPELRDRQKQLYEMFEKLTLCAKLNSTSSDCLDLVDVQSKNRLNRYQMNP